ncbi:MAG TPA: protein kinase, partial [Victivallales bacterium]|nr:protein kinase [Victivallales bacterium]
MPERLKKFIGFFRSEKEKSEYIEVPDADNFDKGLLFCCKCGKKLEFQKGLTIERCPSCKTALYIPLLINDYLIYKPLGGGGEGFVYKARKLNSEKRFAVKLIPPSKQSIKELNYNLIREAKTIEKIGKHKNITELIEYGIFKETPFAVFKLINGERLDEYVSKRKKLSDKKTLSFIMQIIDAEQYILSKGFLYRDLKPENILIEKGGVIKICDFGISLNLDELSSHKNSSDEFEGSP